MASAKRNKNQNKTANPHRGEYEIELGGSTWILYLGTNQVAVLEKNLGYGLRKIFTEETIGVNVIRECLFVGLQKHHKRMTREMVGDMMNISELADYTEVVINAMGLKGEEKDDLDEANEDGEVVPDPLSMKAVSPG